MHRIFDAEYSTQKTMKILRLEDEDSSNDSDLWLSDFEECSVDSNDDSVNEKVWFKVLLIDTLVSKSNFYLESDELTEIKAVLFNNLAQVYQKKKVMEDTLLRKTAVEVV